MSSPRPEIDNSVLDFLWPLILKDNICDTRSEQTSPYFIPEKPFDELWAHTFLSSKNYGQYEPPISFKTGSCIQEDDSTSEKSVLDRTYLSMGENDDIDSGCMNLPEIMPLDKHLEKVQKRKECREKLAQNFANRNYPYYMPRLMSEITSTTDLFGFFTKPFERELLRAIQNFECKFFIINIGPYMCLHRIEIWLKFCKYVKIILIVRKPDIARQLALLNDAIVPMVFEDIIENTWQEELTRALNAAVRHARDVKILDCCTTSFIYVFSSCSNSDCLDRFRVLRKA